MSNEAYAGGVVTTVYISSGRKNAMYTLRQARVAAQFANDNYIMNLARDPEKAEAKAKAWFDRVYGDRDNSGAHKYFYEGFADFELNEVGAPDPWEIRADLMLNQGLMPFGKHKGEPIHDQDEHYILWWADQEIYLEDTEERGTREENGELVEWCHFHEKTSRPATRLIEMMREEAESRGLFEKRRQEEAKRQAERERTQASADVPVTDERIEITGEVVGIKYWAGYAYNSPDIKKIIVLDDRGFKLFGTAPSAILEADRGDRVTFTAAVETSKDDTQFGFFKRPTKAQLLES